jgi:CheY-like chemotaxis protein
MGWPLRVLLVEDSADDAELVVRLLQRGGYDLTYDRVETAPAMEAALQQRRWDVIIADYALPHFNGLAALRVLQEQGLDLPFIVVSGTIGEDLAVAAMKAGAHDYLLEAARSPPPAREASPHGTAAGGGGS